MTIFCQIKINLCFHTEISETSYSVVFTFNLVNISMPEDPERRDNTYPQVLEILNNAVIFRNEQCK